ncbi:alpha-L-rhamnosidase C-terminal domain-containing protein [Nocardioides sp. TF02-7]|uniref:alpha-L-rhamnosidase C-terminal domain-containing protein n=1 Tax=Nocardioides sp. TF02-7 TaxID=2917724 RepID=UPI001F051EF8|nr:alpha-L-rhamnosidase C-terminal domain-containing protein [Nocardioides sp. TF02-7]UMG92569.1 hypothetical protein MF408_22645 [Nocardioides sp. TF02-7]
MGGVPASATTGCGTCRTGRRATGATARPAREAYDNIVYVHTLASAADAAEELGHDDLAEEWRGYADRTADAVNETLWDDEAGAYVAIAGSPAHPLDANALAVASGVAGPDRAERVLDFIQGELARRTATSPPTPRRGTAVPRLHQPVRRRPRAAGVRRGGRHRGGDGRAPPHLGPHAAGRQHRDLLGDRLAGGRARPGVPHEHEPRLGGRADQLPDRAHARCDADRSRLRVLRRLAAAQRGPEWAQGAVPTPQGTIRTAWRRTADGGFRLVVEAPPGTTYTATVPAAATAEVRVDGEKADLSRTSGPATLSGLSRTTTITVEPRS